VKTLVIGLAALAMTAAPLAASAQPFGYGHGGGNGRATWTSNSNRDWNGGRSDYGRGDYGRGDQRSFHRGYDRGDNTGALVAAGVLGLFVGAVLSNANDDNGYRYSQPYDTRASYDYGQDW
jgi:hypothetical protein